MPENPKAEFRIMARCSLDFHVLSTLWMLEVGQLFDAYGNASFTGNNRVVFNIKGNDYRLVVAVRYDKGLMYVRFVGTHRQYDKVDVETIWRSPTWNSS